MFVFSTKYATKLVAIFAACPYNIKFVKMLRNELFNM